MSFLLLVAAGAGAQTYLSEILFNPAGPDAPNQYIELRGKPNSLLAAGTYFLAVNGDAALNPGTVCNLIDLSGRAIGGNGFLLLLQKEYTYAVIWNATVLINTNGPGYGSGLTSSIGHRGKNGATELPHASVTFFLIQTRTPPAIDDDIDTDNNGAPDGPVWANWRVLDSVGVLDSNGPGDVAYGAINYRRDSPPGSGATASGTIVPIGFTPVYVGRAGHSTGHTGLDWVAGDNLQGTAPNWFLSDSTTAPSAYDGEPLNHLGRPNFGAPALHGVVAVTAAGGLVLIEGGVASSYRLGLNTVPAGNVTVQVTADFPLQISVNSGASWVATASLTFNNTILQTVMVRALSERLVDTSPHTRWLRHVITSSADTTKYPTSALAPLLGAAILETEPLWLNELKANPPGTNEGPWEYVEIQGQPNTLLTNVYFLSLESAGAKDPGKLNLVVNLTSHSLGSNGLLVIGAPGNPYGMPLATPRVEDARFAEPGGALGNGSRSFLLVSSPGPLVEGTDLDGGDNGVLEELPPGTTILDSVAWSDGAAGDVLYGTPLNLAEGLPQAALRLPGNTTPNSTNAWVWGDLEETGPASLEFDAEQANPGMSAGTRLTPGTANNSAPAITALPPLSGVIGDPTNPQVYFAVFDRETPAGLLTLTLTSSNQAVVPDSNLSLTPGPDGRQILTINPIGVGYSLITIQASDGTMTGRSAFRYAASDQGRPGGFFHTYVSDGSAAFAVDTNLMFIGDDENQTIRLYWRNTSGSPLAGFDFSNYLNLTELYEDGRPKEMDIEGVTRVGSRILWIGSGSNAEWGDPHPNRNRLFGTDLAGTGTNAQLAFVGRYEHLKDDILNWDANNLHGKGPNYYGLVASAAPGLNPKVEDASGFNIESVTMAPGSTNLAYIGLRAPLIPTTNRVKALVLVVSNFATLTVSGAAQGATRFGPPLELNLIGRGIRAMEANSNGVVIVAGPHGLATGVPPHDFRLFTWAGWTNPPQERAADLSGTSPEALVEVPPGPITSNTSVQLVSDNGVTLYYGDDVLAKKLPVLAFKKFRSDRLRLGPVVISQPILRTWPSPTNGWVLSWYSVAGLTYRVQWATTLQPANWVDLPGDVTATDATAGKTVPPPLVPQCFYRVVIP
jgi:hypothetical protein